MSIDAMKQALEFIKATNKSSSFWLVPESNLNKTVTALRLAIEQAEKQEPVGWITQSGLEVNRTTLFSGKSIAWRIPVYTAPPQQEKQEPVGEVLNERGDVDYLSYVPPAGTPLYTAPPQRQSLTEEEIDAQIKLMWGNAVQGILMHAHRGFARAIERAHGIGGEHD